MLKRPGLKNSASESYTIRNNDANKSHNETLRKDAAQEQTTKGTGDRSTNDTNEKCVRAFKINNVLSVQEKRRRWMQYHKVNTTIMNARR